VTANTRDTLVTFERVTTTQDDYGEEVGTEWTELGKEWANVNWGRGDERRQAAMEQGAQPATFTVLDNPMTREVGLKDRIVLDGTAYDITSNVPGKKRGERDITATRAA
jgi:head-tail adaptor